MSYNHPFRNPPDNMYSDSQRMYPRESSTYRSRIRTTSPDHTQSSSEATVLPPGKALSFLHSCGLDAEDLKSLAELPEHLITSETLPDLLAQIKKKKAANTTSSRCSLSAYSWNDRSDTQTVECPVDLPFRQAYHREQVMTWEDQWGNVQKTSSPTRSYTSSESNYVIEYNHLKNKESIYFDKAAYATEPSRLKTSVVSQSYTNYSRDDSQPSYLSSRDIGESTNRSSRDLSQSTNQSSRDISQSSIRSSRDIGQSSIRSSRGIGQSSNRSSRGVGQSSNRSSRGIGQSSIRSSRDIGIPPLLSSRDIGIPPLLSSRDIGIPPLLSSRNIRIPPLLSGRDVSQTSHISSIPPLLSSRDIGQPAHHRRTEMVHKVPTRKEASDFHGKIPPVFPYACVLCEITVLSNNDWSVHINGAQHANSQLSLVEKYPEWDQKVRSARRNESVPERSQPRATQERGGKSGSRNGSSSNRSGSSSSKRKSSSSNQNKTEASEKCKVVCVKFEAVEVDEAYLKKLLGQFGPIVKMIMFPKLAFAEMGSAEQAEDIVKYFLHNPLRIKGQILDFTLSSAFSFLQSSSVVSFSPLPAGDSISSELMAVAKRFGSVKHSLFLPSRGYVEMANPEEASKLVEHYSTNLLKLKGKTINVCFSSEYKTLGEKEISPIPQSSSRRRRRSASPQKRSHSSRRDSPSPKRRSSEERSRSRRSSNSKKRDDGQRSKESSRRVSSRRDSSSKAHSKKSSKDQSKKTDESAKKIDENKDQSDTMEDDTIDQSKTMEDDTMDQSEIMEDDVNYQSDIMEDDSDLEGVAVIADDGEALNSENEELKEDAEPDHQVQDASAELTQQETSEEMPNVEQSNDQTILQDMDASNKHPEMSEHVLDATTTNGSCDPKEAQELKQETLKDQTVAMDEEIEDFPKSLDNCITLDEFKEKMVEEHETEQGDDQEILASSTEEKFGKVLEVIGFPVAKKYSEADLLNIGKKYGDVTDCCLVRNNGKVEKALIEMVNAADAAKIEAESSKKKIKLGGRILRITVSKTYIQVKEGKSVDSESGKVECEEQDDEIKKEFLHSETSCEENSGVLEETVKASEEGAEASVESNMDTVMQMSSDEEEDYGKVLWIRNLPLANEYSDADFLSIAETYGKVARHWLLRTHRTGLIEMENASDAEKVVAAANMKEITIAGKHPMIAVSTKHRHLNKRYFHQGSSDETVQQTLAELEAAENGSKTHNNISDQLSESVKESSNDEQDINSKGDEKQLSASDDLTETMVENSDSSETQTHLNDPAGTEFIRPVVGYFCSLCNAIYASEEEAKNEHCRTVMHHQKLKECMEQKSST
ncbi:uncharacterized protein LOC127617264 isoform X2 [Xyrauchen texanus]|uniref:uncharacterized protein LOC127617264 isoform X2 n=1 Tax=Xyrauchen texanus TaxID=154827 RepID=UPI0022427052|nr:uncharacterized protein LOC127617264 isoform X2 [Xyrauchen texanus]